MKKDKDALVKEYINCALIQGEATLDGDYKRGNIAAKKLIKLYKIMEQDNHLAIQMLDVLLKDDNTNVRLCASAHALGLNINVSEATSILEEISARKDVGILRLDAEMALKIYNERGYLKFY
jgi:hypothetical protein